MRLDSCHNFHDFRRVAERRLPSPIFDYIDGAADDEVTYRRNTAAFESCDLVPNVLQGVGDVDMSVTVMGQTLAMPVYCSPTALQRLFHHQGERAVAAAAAKYGTMFGVSSLGTVSLEEARRISGGPQVYQFYFHKDRGLNRDMMARAKTAGVPVMMLTVDSITGGNRERDKRTGFAIPFRLNLAGLAQFALRPAWAVNYFTHEPFRLPQLDGHVDMGRGAVSISHYFTEMLDPSMSWDDVSAMVQAWGGQFCLKGVMSVQDAKRAAEIGCTGIVLSNHGGRQLDGSRTAFDQLAEVVDAVGDRLDVLVDGGVQRGTHVLKALALGAKAVGLGRYYLFPLAAAGQPGVERALELMRHEIERGMKLMGCSSISQLKREHLRIRRSGAADAAIAQGILTGAGCRVMTASSGEEAQDLDERNGSDHFDLLLTNLILLGGMTCLSQSDPVMEGDTNVSILLTVGHDEEVVVNGLRKRTTDVLCKPCRRSDLPDRVRQALHRRGSEDPHRKRSDFGPAEA